MIVNVFVAKANLTKLVNMVNHGEKVVITKDNMPLVDLVIHKPAGRRNLELLSGKLKFPEGIMEEDTDINEMSYGKKGK